MIRIVLSAMAIAFTFSLAYGKKLIPWLKKKGFEQPLKREVEEEIYSMINSSEE